LAVEDNGCGMPPELRLRLFEPFLTTKASGHLGLGLVLAREMTHAQGGVLEVASAAGRGTAVTLCFPALASEPAPADEHRPSPLREGPAPAEASRRWPEAPAWGLNRQTA
jgi:nitrogen-specific signal transduction histidine kinase